MRIHYLVEGRSEAELLERWLPRALPGHLHRVYPHEGKGRLPADPGARPQPQQRGLLDQLPAKLRAFGQSHDPATDRTLVLVDADDQDCVALKQQLIQVLQSCQPAPMTLFRIAIEETEAFYLGDAAAIRAAFGQANRAELKQYRQDSICGTWEVFQRVIHWPREDKVKWAKVIGPHLATDRSGPRRNRSPSFLAFYQAACRLAGESWP